MGPTSDTLTRMATSPSARIGMPRLGRLSAALLVVGVFVALVALCAVDAVVAHVDHLGLDGCCGITHCSSALLGFTGFVVWAAFVAIRPAIDGSLRSTAVCPPLPPPERRLVPVV